ncbi:MarR family transcriptional regulator [Altererythrobacter xixiisoli]|uniref:MarR family transcriptional regulator n=1 Tax=Croceibacterium xixiisoli TaxID=1476466 RepID=A0A6I4TSX0_9SPHN|nr:MarR family transcriptional regulator [Croceibacterium xixiisoli]MXO97708.1 MarR family transcriptional regulator [Croceibacterium xixiisoli]
MTVPPDSPRARFGMRFSLLARRWRRAIDAHLAAAGLTDATWVPLVHLHETGGGLTQKELAALVGIDGSSLVRLLDILTRQGLVERRVSASDARARLVHLTPLGEQRVAEIRAALLRGEEVMLADLADADLSDMLAHFARIDARLAAIEAEGKEA